MYENFVSAEFMLSSKLEHHLETIHLRLRCAVSTTFFFFICQTDKRIETIITKKEKLHFLTPHQCQTTLCWHLTRWLIGLQNVQNHIPSQKSILPAAVDMVNIMVGGWSNIMLGSCF